VSLYQRQYFYRTWLRATRWVSCKNQELITLSDYMSLPPFCGIRVAHHFSFMCCGLVCLSSLCVMWPLFPVSLDCLFLHSIYCITVGLVLVMKLRIWCMHLRHRNSVMFNYVDEGINKYFFLRSSDWVYLTK
jgi:hypothetical protein